MSSARLATPSATSRTDTWSGRPVLGVARAWMPWPMRLAPCSIASSMLKHDSPPPHSSPACGCT
eukprot:3113014-Prymnesium_polylepis.1